MRAQNRMAFIGGVDSVAELISSLVRGLFMLLAGALVLVVAGVLLLFTLAFVLVALVRGAITGNRPTAQAQWGRFRESTASQVWQRYRAAATAERPTANSRPTQDVEDVPYREIANRASAAEPESRPSNP